MALKNSVQAVPLTYIDTATLHAVNWKAIDTGGLSHPCFLLRFVNMAATNVEISYDGVTAHEIIPFSSTVQLSFQRNSQYPNKVAKMPKGTVLYARGTPVVGSLNVSGYYQV